MLLAMAGSDDAFATLVRRHQAALVGLLRRVCGDAALAEDIAQASFLRAWRNIVSLRDATRFSPWLRRIAMRTVVDAARSQERFAQLDEAADLPDHHGPTQADERVDLEGALRRLSTTQRACVLLSYAEGMTHPEIAAALGMPIGTVKSHVARGAEILRRALTSGDEHG